MIKGKHSGLGKAVSLTLVMALGSRATWATDLTLYGTENYKDAVVVSVTPRQTLIWVADQPQILANNNFWGKTRDTFGNPDLFKLPPRVQLADGTVLKSAQIQSFDQFGLTLWDGSQQRHCLYPALPKSIGAKYPFTDVTRAEYRAEYSKLQEMSRAAAAEAAARQQAAAAAQAQATREVEQAQAETNAAAQRREDGKKIVVGAAALLLLGVAAKAMLGGDDSSAGSNADEARDEQDRQNFAAGIMRQNRERNEKEDLERKQALEDNLRRQRAQEQAELNSRPRF